MSNNELGVIVTLALLALVLYVRKPLAGNLFSLAVVAGSLWYVALDVARNAGLI